MKMQWLLAVLALILPCVQVGRSGQDSEAPGEDKDAALLPCMMYRAGGAAKESSFAVLCGCKIAHRIFDGTFVPTSLGRFRALT